MGNKWWKTGSIFLLITIMLNFVPSPIYSEPVWKEKYREYIQAFLSNPSEKESIGGDTIFVLVDLDLDDTPELIIGDSHRTVNYIRSAVTLRDGEVIQLKTAGKGLGENGGIGMAAFENIKLYKLNATGELVYIGEDSAGGLGSWGTGNYFLSLKGDTITSNEISFVEVIYGADNEYVKYFFNGKELSETDYHQMRKDLYSQLTEIGQVSASVPVMRLFAEYDVYEIDEMMITNELFKEYDANSVLLEGLEESSIQFTNVLDQMSSIEKSEITGYLGQFPTLSSFDITNYTTEEIMDVINDNTNKYGIGLLAKIQREQPDRWKMLLIPGRNYETLYAEFEVSEVNQYALELFGVEIPDPSSSEYYFNGKFYLPDWAAGGGYPYSPQITQIYRLADDLWYVEFIKHYLGEGIESTEGLPGYAVIKKTTRNGKVSWNLIKYDTTTPKLSNKELVKYQKQPPTVSRIDIDYSRVTHFQTIEQFLDLLRQQFTEENLSPLNDSDKAEISKFIEYAIQQLNQVNVTVSNNIIHLSGEILSKPLQSLTETQLEFDKLLNEHRITLNKNYDRILLLNIVNADLEKPILLRFDESLIQQIHMVDGINISLESNRHLVSVSSANLRGLLEESPIVVQFHKKAAGKYTIVFFDRFNNVIDKIAYPITFEFPAGGEYSSVFVNYRNGSDNWGGQFNANTKTISISTRFSGDYEVIENHVVAEDISHLAEETKKAIDFMVSKGYFTLDGMKFIPDSPIDRNHLTMALVKMFFALDRTLQTTFTDVSKDDEFHDYIASAQRDHIVNGYEDNTFRGKVNVTIEQLIALASRTLVEKKGYEYPDDLDPYLSFVDSDRISEWARKDVALAVREGLIQGGGLLFPQADTTRAQAAEILYKLFMLLYDVPPALFQALMSQESISTDISQEIEPVSTSPETDAQADSTVSTSRALLPVVLTIVLLALIAAGGGGYWWIKRKSKGMDLCQ